MAELFPAYAGVIPGTSGRAGHGKTFPRPCGGDPCGVFGAVIRDKLFPAYAGVIPKPYVFDLKTVAFPRPRGGDPYYDYVDTLRESFSPPMRG